MPRSSSTIVLNRIHIKTNLLRIYKYKIHSIILRVCRLNSNVWLFFIYVSMRDLNFNIFFFRVKFLTHEIHIFHCSRLFCLQVNKLNGHSARVGALAWNSDILSSGSRDRLIMQRDTRTPPQSCERRLEGHRQEVCGLKWSPGR